MARTRTSVGLAVAGVVAAGAAYWYASSPSSNSLVFRPLSGSWHWVSTYGTDKLTGVCTGLPLVQRTAEGPATLSAATDGTSFRLDIDGQTVLFHRPGLQPDFESGRSSFPIGSPDEGRSGDVWFEAHVASPSSITGATRWVAEGCEANYPFTLTLETEFEPEGVVPSAGLWQVVASPSSCPMGTADFTIAFALPAELSLVVTNVTLVPAGGSPIILTRNGPLAWSGAAVVNGVVGGIPQPFIGTLHVTFIEDTRAVATFVGSGAGCNVASSLNMTRVGSG